MSDANVDISVTVDTTQSQAQVAQLQAEVNRVDREWQHRRTVIYREVEEALTRINRLIHVFRNVLRMLNITLDPVSEAVMDTLTSIVSYMVALKAAYAASGPWGWVMLAVTAFAFGLALAAQANAWKALIEAHAAGAKAERLFGQVKDIGSTFGPAGRTG